MKEEDTWEELRRITPLWVIGRIQWLLDNNPRIQAVDLYKFIADDLWVGKELNPDGTHANDQGH